MARVQVAADSFPTDGDLTGDGKNWSVLTGTSPTPWKVVGGRATEYTDEHRTVVYGANTFQNDQYATANLYGIDYNDPTYRAGVIVRASGSGATANYYSAWVTTTVGNYVLYVQKVVNNVGTNLHSGTVISFALGDSLTLEVDGGATTKLRLYRNGSTLLVPEITDSTNPHLSGRPGMVGRNSAAQMDNWVAGNLGTASASITLTPDPASAVVGGTTQITGTRSVAAPAGGGVTYNLTSSAPAVATVPATVSMAEGQTTATFNVTGVSLGSATITATNAADSSETDSSTVNVVTTRKLKLLAHIDALGATAVKGAVFAAPTGGALVGAKIGEFTGAAFKSTSESGQAPLEVAVADFGGSALTTADTPVCVWEGTSSATSALGNAAPIGSNGVHECTVIEV